jgi:single-stranded-DNA-specific exonuclease
VEDFVATLLVQRGIETFEDAKVFFRPSLDHLHDPFLMKDG